jgi:two-component system, chemotaxis family, response regulator Rcp1
MGGSGSSPNPEEDRPSASRSLSEEAKLNLPLILIVEDNTADVFLIRQAIKTANIPADIRVVKDGEQAIRFFDDADGDDATPCPALAIVDINLPRKQGGEVLRYMRKSRRCADALVIAISTSGSPRDREEMMKLGANGYFRKPSEYADFMRLGEMIKDLIGAK